VLSIGLSCWLERNRNQSGSRVGIVPALTVYNAAIVALMIYAAVVDGMNGVGIWLAFGLHTLLLIWCAACLRADSRGDVRVVR